MKKFKDLDFSSKKSSYNTKYQENRKDCCNIHFSNELINNFTDKNHKNFKDIKPFLKKYSKK